MCSGEPGLDNWTPPHHPHHHSAPPQSCSATGSIKPALFLWPGSGPWKWKCVCECGRVYDTERKKECALTGKLGGRGIYIYILATFGQWCVCVCMYLCVMTLCCMSLPHTSSKGSLPLSMKHINPSGSATVKRFKRSSLLNRSFREGFFFTYKSNTVILILCVCISNESCGLLVMSIDIRKQ